MVALNSYLPGLARQSSEVVALHQELVQEEDEPELEGEDNSNLLGHKTLSIDDQKKLDVAVSKATSRISGHGIALGYGAGIFMLCLTMIPVIQMKGSTFSLRLAIGISGIWWFIFSIPAALWLSSPVDKEEETKEWSTKREIIAAWKRLGSMLHPREIMRLRNTFKYLAAWFLLSDGAKHSQSSLINRIYYHHIHCRIIWKEHTQYAGFLFDNNEYPFSVGRYSGILSMASHTATIQLV